VSQTAFLECGASGCPPTVPSPDGPAPVEANPLNGKYAVSSDQSLLYQISEVRLGPPGQAVNFYLNGVPGQDYTLATPWIWSAIQYDAQGKTVGWVSGDNLQIFPAYQIYANSFALPPIPQGDVSVFSSLDATSQYRGQQ